MEHIPTNNFLSLKQFDFINERSTLQPLNIMADLTLAGVIKNLFAFSGEIALKNNHYYYYYIPSFY